MENQYLKVNASELTKMVIEAPIGSVISFGSPDDDDYSLSSRDKETIQFWDGCYVDYGKMDNRYFMIDHYGGGQTYCETLEDVCYRDRLTELDKEYIESALERYIKAWVGNEFVYAKVEAL